MARILVQIVLPLLLPFAIYAAWLAVENRRLERLGRGERPSWGEAPWIWLVALGVLLAVSATMGAALFGGESPDGVYVPPRVGPDGRVIPGHVEPHRP